MFGFQTVWFSDNFFSNVSENLTLGTNFRHMSKIWQNFGIQTHRGVWNPNSQKFGFQKSLVFKSSDIFYNSIFMPCKLLCLIYFLPCEMKDRAHVDVVTGLVAFHTILRVVKNPRLPEVLLEHRSGLVLNTIQTLSLRYSCVQLNH